VCSSDLACSVVEGASSKGQAHMNAAPVVVAFSDSRAVRETLSVLLEHDCELRFMAHDGAPAADTMLADLALVAVRRSTAVVRDLLRRCPTMPIVAVQLPDVSAPTIPPPTRVDCVPLEPHAIRAAVLRKLSDTASAPLAATLRLVGVALHAEIAHTLGGLRSCAALCGSSAAVDVLAVMMREQAQIIACAFEQLERFRRRPRRVERADDFALALCRALEAREDAPVARPLLYECSVDDDCTRRAGPVSLIPLVVGLLRAHLSRRCDAPPVRVSAQRDGVILRYPPRPAAASTASSWPLLLVSLALQPCAWQILCATGQAEEALRICPA
jgi:hypothetical protein